MIHLEQKQSIYKSFLFFLSFTCFMIFAGLLSAYLVSSQDVYWIITPAPFWLYLALGILLLSSGTFILSLKAIKQNKSKQICTKQNWFALSHLNLIRLCFPKIVKNKLSDGTLPISGSCFEGRNLVFHLWGGWRPTVRTTFSRHLDMIHFYVAF